MRFTLPEFGGRDDRGDGSDRRDLPREVVATDEFVLCLEKMEPELQRRSVQTIRQLVGNPRHPSLNAHKVKAVPDKWECYVTDRHRIIYDSNRRELRLWQIGDHSVIDRVRCLSFSSNTCFRRLAATVPANQSTTEPAQSTPHRGSRKRAGDANPFTLVPAAHLRVLGVPSDKVDAIRLASTPEDAVSIPGLPDHTKEWLLELLTNPGLSDVLCDPGRLLFRTTLDKLQGYCEGRIRRLMLNLEDEQRTHVDRKLDGAQLLRGCAGSGKTTVAIYRAIRCAELGQKTIFLTYNRTLAAAACALIEELIGPLPTNLEVTNIDSWIYRLLQSRGRDVPLLKDKEASKILKDVLTRLPPELRAHIESVGLSFAYDEILKVIKSNGLNSESAYLSFQRRGRDTALRARARSTIWAAFELYQQELQRSGRMEWHEARLRALATLQQEPLDDPYDHVVIDEAQDLTATHLRIAQQIMKGRVPSSAVQSLFLVGDVSQTLYTRGFSWRQAGLQLQGRSSSLRRNFRNTKQIAEAAAALNATNALAKQSEDYVPPEVTTRQGPRPIIIRCNVTDQERRAVREKMLELAAGNEFRISDFAIICPTNTLCNDMAVFLQGRDIPCMKHGETDFNILAESVKILTIHSAKGLEFPVVFVLGLHKGTLPFYAHGTDPEERAEQLEQQRTLLYVAMTRAAEVLYLVTSDEKPSCFLAEFSEFVRGERFVGGKDK